ncbi:MAG TPA: hypothetical protein VFM93_14670 [Candidatus Limnocylindria bacterium]|nr:hypothetical protein [Candidatus Limnocylindria bacterium]
MKRALAAGLVLAAACVPQAVTPSPTPTATATATAAATTAPPSPTATGRSVPPFARATPVAVPRDAFNVAFDRDRVAYLDGSEVFVIEVATGQRKSLHKVGQGWTAELDPAGLAGDTLVLIETRTDGQRTDGRVLRFDLRGGAPVTLDDFSGPFLGGGDTYRPRPPVTNGRDALWIRVDEDTRPFGIDVVVSRGGGAKQDLQTGSSAVWIDLGEDGRVLISTLLAQGDRSELTLVRDGARTSLGTRPPEQGGPAFFVAGGVYWSIGTGIVRPTSSGEQLSLDGSQRRTIELGSGCNWIGATAKHIGIFCQGTGPRIIDLATSEERGIPATAARFAPRAVLWLEGGQWWLGAL